MQFSLRQLLWFVTVCALAAWLLTLPSRHIVPRMYCNPETGDLGWEEDRTLRTPEACERVLLCAMLFAAPVVVRWRRSK